MFVSKHKSLGFYLGFFVILVTRAAMTPPSTTAPTATSWILRSTQRATALCWGCSPWAVSMVLLETTDRISRRCHSWQRRCRFKVPKHATTLGVFVVSAMVSWHANHLQNCFSSKMWSHSVTYAHIVHPARSFGGEAWLWTASEIDTKTARTDFWNMAGIHAELSELLWRWWIQGHSFLSMLEGGG